MRTSFGIRTRLFAAISCLVILSGIVIAQWVVYQYAESLLQTAAAQAENQAHSLALDAADKILLNDLVGLQKLIDDQIKSNPAIGYLFLHKDQSVLAHSFAHNVPRELLSLHAASAGDRPGTEKIMNESGERFLDVSWPILGGEAGILRLGYSEKPFRDRVQTLRAQIFVLTGVILVVSLGVAHLLVRRTTRQLLALAETAEGIDAENPSLQLPEFNRDDEVGRLAIAFRTMVARIRDRTQRLEEYSDALERKNTELGKAQQQVRIVLEIVKDLGEISTLEEICRYLVERLKDVITCRKVVLVLGTEPSGALMVFTEGSIRLPEGKTLEALEGILNDYTEFSFVDPDRVSHLSAAELADAENVAVFPVRHEGRLLGSMCVGCPGQCKCVTTEMDVIHLVLSQSSGAIRRAIRQEEEIRKLRHQIEQSSGYGELIGKDPKMQIVYKMIEDIAPSDATVLIQGESGTGKEVVARAIHAASARKDRPFVVINCSAYPATLLESELFGYEKGAFTGAVKQKAGRFEQADGGTVFLDEIGEISPAAQIKLLRVLQHRRFERLGGSTTIPVDVRILAATNRDLLSSVKKGNFREDLYYRLKVIPLTLPPLRQRKNDIPMLARHFVKRFAAMQKKTVRDIHSRAMREMMRYSWPGNVRELENAVEHAVVLTRGDQIDVSDIPEAILNRENESAEPATPTRLEDTEKQHLVTVLDACGWNKTDAARQLGIGRSTLYGKLRRYGIRPPSI